MNHSTICSRQHPFITFTFPRHHYCSYQPVFSLISVLYHHFVHSRIHHGVNSSRHPSLFMIHFLQRLLLLLLILSYIFLNHTFIHYLINHSTTSPRQVTPANRSAGLNHPYCSYQSSSSLLCIFHHHFVHSIISHLVKSSSKLFPGITHFPLRSLLSLSIRMFHHLRLVTTISCILSFITLPTPHAGGQAGKHSEHVTPWQ